MRFSGYLQSWHTKKQQLPKVLHEPSASLNIIKRKKHNQKIGRIYHNNKVTPSPARASNSSLWPRSLLSVPWPGNILANCCLNPIFLLPRFISRKFHKLGLQIPKRLGEFVAVLGILIQRDA